MDNRIIEARELVIKARESLRRGDKASARQLGERAAFLAPDMEDVWLVLAASDLNPQDALAYARKALQINPHSTRARRGVAWASSQLEQAQASTVPSPVLPTPIQASPVAPLPKNHAYQTAVAVPALRSQERNWLLPALLAGAGVLFLGLIALIALIANYPALASIINRVSVPAATQEYLWAPVEIAKPELTPIDGDEVAVQLEDTPAATLAPTLAPSNAPATQTPGSEPTQEATILPAATETPGEMVMEIVPDTPTREYVAPTPGISVGNGERWIDVDLTNQMLYAYEGDVLVNSFIVSTGTWLTPTVTGKHKIYVKVRMQDMRGPGYHLRDVPYVMFFKGDYGLHGTYWHNNFGTPMSRGCVNLTIDDAAWLFDWASVGTIVNVHY
ncbi:MAG TPA: L,D-transpeptidase [Anaerolineales bacterium]